ncbi:hypothetical protein [Amycolatopsis anabasis]|uniref:hypothetical protein n=1 Tax=Amycolatopsis anabasis TaxID=1840409 RepID=UPI00131E1B8F|nr:hypothetical protein [Amycolatopsis anabasis]
MTTQMTLPAITFALDVERLRALAASGRGRITQVAYNHETYYPNQAGPTFQFETTDGTVLVVEPDGDNWTVRDKETFNDVRTELDAGLRELLATIWEALDTAYQETILPAVLRTTSQVLWDTFTGETTAATTVPVDLDTVTEEVDDFARTYGLPRENAALALIKKGLRPGVRNSVSGNVGGPVTQFRDVNGTLSIR